MVTAIVSQVDSRTELDTFWTNLYLRGQMLFDPTAHVGNVLYQQPYGGVPFSRGWIIGADQTVIAPIFGHDPTRVISIIYDHVVALSPPGDRDGDGDTDLDDYAALVGCVAGPDTNYATPHCRLLDLDNDGDVDLRDFGAFQAAFTQTP